jgi:hypothetical protein
MFFAQAAYALAACQSARTGSLAQMIAQPAVDAAPCHAAQESASLCLAHCQSEEQTLDKHQPKVPQASHSAVLTVNAAPALALQARSTLRAPLPAVGPPPRILFRTLLI